LFYREKVTKAFWFAETYGLVLKELKMEDTTGNDINVTLTGTIIQGTCNKIQSKKICGFLLYLMNKYTPITIKVASEKNDA